jgi:hypothetical protein
MFRAKLLIGAVAAACALSAASVMAQGYWDANAKASGRFGTGFYSGGMQSAGVYRAAPVYAAPQIVRTMPAPMPSAPQIAQAPTDRRSFSVEPSQGEPAASASVAAPQVTRSYSYEPAYSSPVRSGRSGMPSYLLPASDPRKHGG